MQTFTLTETKFRTKSTLQTLIHSKFFIHNPSVPLYMRLNVISILMLLLIEQFPLNTLMGERIHHFKGEFVRAKVESPFEG
jgi:hypothetical protein